MLADGVEDNPGTIVSFPDEAVGHRHVTGKKANFAFVPHRQRKSTTYHGYVLKGAGKQKTIYDGDAGHHWA